MTNKLGEYAENFDSRLKGKTLRMKWFKHYANANESCELSIILEEMGNEGYGLYWRILELLCGNYDGESTSFEFRTSTVKRFLGLRTTNKLSIIARLLTNDESITIELTKTSVIFNAPILAKLKDRDFKKSRKGRAECALEEKRIDKIRIEESRETHPVLISSNSITPSEIIELYNSKLAGSGKLKIIPDFDLSSDSLDNFITLTGFSRYQKLKGWEDYFSKVEESIFLTGREGKGGCATLNWLLDPNNAEKVNQGQYQNDTKKTQERDLSHLNRGAK